MIFSRRIAFQFFDGFDKRHQTIYLKTSTQAHELKQKQATVEAEIAKLETEHEFVAFSPLVQTIMAAKISDVTASPLSPAVSNEKSSIATTPPKAGLVKTPNSTLGKKARSINNVTNHSRGALLSSKYVLHPFSCA